MPPGSEKSSIEASSISLLRIKRLLVRLSDLTCRALKCSLPADSPIGHLLEEDPVDTRRSELAEQVVEAAIEYRRAEAMAAYDPVTQAEAQLALDAAIESWEQGTQGRQ